MEEWNSGKMEEKHINNPTSFQHSNIPAFQYSIISVDF